MSNLTRLKSIWIFLLVLDSIFTFSITQKGKPTMTIHALFNWSGFTDLVFITIATGLLVLSLFIPKILGVQSLAEPEIAKASVEELARKASHAFEFQWALDSGVILLSYGLALFDHNVQKLLPFVMTSLLFLLITFPSQSRIRQVIEGDGWKFHYKIDENFP